MTRARASTTGDSADPVGSHVLFDVLEVLVGAAAYDAPAHDFADSDVGGRPSLGHDAEREVAIGEDADDPPGPGVDNR